MPRDARSVSGIPEPPMAQATGTGLLTMLRRPFADPNLRRLITFLGTWNLAVNLAAPFFTVFMLTMLHMDMTMVMGLSVVLLVPLASGNIGLKSAFKGEATAYLAVLSLVNALAAGLAPIFGGL